MATSIAAVTRRVLAVGSRRPASSISPITLTCLSSHAHRSRSINAVRHTSAGSHNEQSKGSSKRQAICPSIAAPRPSISVTLLASASSPLRSFSSQVDGLGQTETFKEYRIRQEIEQRRRILRELEHDALRSDSELADLRLELSEYQLDGMSHNPKPPGSADTAATSIGATSPTAAATVKILQSLTPHENIYTLPNFLTFTRLIAAPAVGYAILTSQPTLALALFAYAGATDAIDGYLARRFNQTTVVGTVIDPMADKLLMTIAVVSLAVQATIPLWLAVIIIGRDVGLAISAIYFRYISLPPPKTFARYWDFSLPSAEVHPTEISKINTLLQLLLIGSAMALPVLRENAPALVDAWNLGGVVEGWSYLVGGTTIWSGLSYIGNKDAVKILSDEEKDKRSTKGGEVKNLGPLYRKE